MQYHYSINQRVCKGEKNICTAKKKDRIIIRTGTDRGLNILEMNGEEDHVHILFECDPYTAVGELISVVKTQSSRFVRKIYGESVLKKWYWKPYFWSESYFVTTVGENSLENVKRYIKDQGNP